MKSWVYTIAKNTITDYYRKKKTHTDELKETFFEDDDECTDNQSVEELSNYITPFIKQLPKEFGDIMTLYELENMPQKEIAEKLSMNYVTVRSKIQRARKKLKNVFTDCCTIKQGPKGTIVGHERNHGQEGCESFKGKIDL